MKTLRDVIVLFVDDEPDLLSSLRRFLRREPYQKIFANSGREALEILSARPVDIVVSDLRMPEMDGMALLGRVKAGYPDIIRLILSATRDVEQTIDAINTGEVYRFISKPLDPEPFKRILQDVVDYHLLIAGRQEMMTAIEQHLLQAAPPQDLSGATMAALMIPAGHLDGDFADYFVYSNRQVDLLVGDVMGKGVQSALVAASIKQQFAKSLAVYDCGEVPRNSCPREQGHDFTTVSRIVSNVHTGCIASLLELEMFVTLSFARIDLAAGQMGLVDCGHLPVIHFQAATGACTFLKGENPALGMVAQQDYQVVHADIRPGDVLLFYSDGVTETQSAAGELFGEQRLVSLVQAHHDQAPTDLAATIREAAAVFGDSDRFTDDFTCIVVRIDD